MKISKADFRKVLAAFLTTFACGYSLLITLCAIPKENANTANNIWGFLSAMALAAIIGFYFGGNEESDKKNAKSE